MKTLRSSVSGFTLTELMIVITIVGILATIAIPSFKSLTESQRVKNASFELFTILSLARNEAIKRNCEVTMTPTIVGGVLTSLVITSGTLCGVGGGAMIDTKPAPKGVDIDTAVASVTYTRNGRTTVTAAPITFDIDVAGATTPTRNARCITIELSGMPRTRMGACS